MALISIVMPAYNAETYIAEAIASVLAQTFDDWELLIVNDGSTDGTAAAIASFDDPRIRLFHQRNAGIGAARNSALHHATGAYLCFLDADDVLPPRSLQARMELLIRNPEVDIADGRMVEMDSTMTRTLRVFQPTFTGMPFSELVRLSGSCFAGVTWMLRWPVTPPLRFEEASTQMEDLMFILAYSQPGRRYAHVDEEVLLYRRTGKSSTSDLRGMERSYKHVHRWLVSKGWASRKDLRRFRYRSRRVMAASWLHAGKPLHAMRSVIDPF